MAKPVAGINVFQNNTTNALSNLDANFSNIVSAINDPASYTNYGIDIGSANAYVVTLTGYNFLSYTNGQVFAVDIANTNTISAATLNINGLGAKQIYRQDGTPLAAGDLTAGNIFQFFYNSSLNLGTGGFGLSGAVTIPTSANQQFNSIGVGVAPTGVAGNIKGTSLTLSAGASLGGLFTNSAQPAFFAKNTASRAVGVHSSEVLFDTIVQQNGSGYDKASGTFTCPNTGWYMFTAAIAINNGTAGAVGAVLFIASAVSDAPSPYALFSTTVSAGTSQPLIATAGPIYLAANATVMVLTQGGPTSQTVVAQGTSFPSYFYGAQLF